jgi:hypothetical protein
MLVVGILLDTTLPHADYIMVPVMGSDSKMDIEY